MHEPLNETLNPTLWRTCRVLANAHRLALLEYLTTRAYATVGQVAAALDLPVATASLQLRVLAARGLIVPTRSGRYVHYAFRADPRVRQAVALHRALDWMFAHDRRPCDTIYRLATAFTHPRRIDIVCVLRRQALSFSAIKTACGLSHAATIRHLRKLLDRGVVERTETGIRVAQSAHPLTKAFLALANADRSER
jgi:DNA-binding transcriptional ArsR family regulator